MSLRVGQPVPRALLDAPLLEPGRPPESLADLAAGRPAVVVFLRHFGCIGCSQHVTDLAPRVGELDRLGVAVVFIGNGQPDQVRGFVERHRLEGYAAHFKTDPTLRVFELAGLKRSAVASIGPRALWAHLMAWGQGHKGGAIEGDPWQQGGALVIDRDGTLLAHHESRGVGDNADGSDLVAAALRATARVARDGGVT